VPPPRAHLTRFHGVFAPNANLRAQLTACGRGKRPPADEASTGANSDHRSPDEKRRAMTWAQRLQRVFGNDVSTCVHYGGTLRIVANIEQPTAIRAIPARGHPCLAHFAKHGALEQTRYRPAPRAPPAVAAWHPAGHDAEGETRQDNTKLQPTRSAELCPLSGIEDKRTTNGARRAPALPKSHSRTSDPRPNRRLRDHRLFARPLEKGV